MLISVLTGFSAGAVHVVSGADHIVAMAPSSVRKPRVALINGLAWGDWALSRGFNSLDIRDFG